MKQEEKALLSKNKIAEAALNLFSTKGYDATTMQDIIEDSGMSKGAIYHYFKSKQEILAYLSNYEKKQLSDFLKALVENPDIKSKEKIENIITYFFENKALPNLTKNKWAEKVPFALLDTLKNSLNVLAKYFEEILRQGNKNNEFQCIYPKELSGVFVLLIDIWLDPIIVDSTYEEMCDKVDFITLLLNRFDTPILSEKLNLMIKEGLRQYYD